MIHTIYEKIEKIQEYLNNSINYLGYTYILEDKEERDFTCKIIKEHIKLLEKHLNELIDYE
jgi:hypothetical protein